MYKQGNSIISDIICFEQKRLKPSLLVSSEHMGLSLLKKSLSLLKEIYVYICCADGIS